MLVFAIQISMFGKNTLPKRGKFGCYVKFTSFSFLEEEPL